MVVCYSSSQESIGFDDVGLSPTEFADLGAWQGWTQARGWRRMRGKRTNEKQENGKENQSKLECSRERVLFSI
jgi:hypothetical protein